MSIKTLIYRIAPAGLIRELRHRKHLADLATDVEPESATVRQLLLPGQTVLDIGANYGVFTKLFSELVGPAGRVLAFEPVPETCRTLAAGVRRYGMSNVQVFSNAVSDRAGHLSMTIPPNSDGYGDNLCCAHVTPPVDSPDSFTVESLTIDSLHLPRVDFIKIDVEGHELEVLRGCRDTITRCHPALMVEVTTQSTVNFLCDELHYPPPVTISPSNELFTYRS
jgi:FkbM family methyltransferase